MQDDFPELLRSIFRSSLNEEFEEKLFEETEGNPLFAIETLNMLVDEGYLSEKDGRWTLTAPMEKIGIPSKVHEVITRRIRRLGRKERKLLNLAAVCGYSFTSDMLSEALTLDVADVLQTLAELERRHRLIRSTDSAFEFSHDKIREVIYGNMHSELRRIYHLKIASCLEQALTKKITDGYMANIALHSVEGGAPEKAFEYLLKLGEKAVEISANAQAIDYLNKALEATRTNASLASSENLARIYKIRGRAWIGQGEAAKAVDDFNLLLQNAISLGDESVLTESHYWLGEALTLQYKWSEANRNFLRAIEIARKTGNKLVECRSLASLGWALIWHLDTLEESRMKLEEASKISTEIGDRVAYARSRFWLAFFYNWRGEFDLARESIDEALKLLEELGDRFHTLQALVFLGWINSGKGEYNDAISAIQRCLQLAQKWNVVYWDRATMPLTLLGWIYRDLSNIELALRYDREALENAKLSARTRIEKAGTIVAALVDLGMDYLHRNDYENAEKCFEEATPLIPLHRSATWRIEIRRLLGFAEIALAKGDFQNALKSAEDSLVISEKAGARKYIAQALKLKSEALTGKGNLREAIELMENALKISQQVGNPPLLWQTQYSMGFLLEKLGDSQKAIEHYARAIALIEAVASKLDDVVLKSSLLASQNTRAIRDAYARTKLTQEKAAGLERFEHAHLQASLAVPNEVTVGETFEARLDVANVAKQPAVLVRIENLVPSNLSVTHIIPKYRLEEGLLNLKGKRLEPQKVESIRIRAAAPESGIIHLCPRIVYVGELGKFEICQPNPVAVAIYPPGKFQFKTNNAQKMFEYLTKAFVEDYMKRKLTREKSGWRTLMQIVKNAKISKSSIYGTTTRRGPAVAELERRGVVETRIFPQERGRGGRITKARIAYEKDIIKRYIDEQVKKNKEK